MNESKYKALQDEYVELHRKVMKIKTPKPQHIRHGVAWTTSEMTAIMNRLNDIEEIIKMDALREFIISISSKI